MHNHFARHEVERAREVVIEKFMNCDFINQCRIIQILCQALASTRLNLFEGIDDRFGTDIEYFWGARVGRLRNYPVGRLKID